MDTTAIDRVIPFMEKGKWYTCKDFPNYGAITATKGYRKYSVVSGILSEASKNHPEMIVRRLRSRETRRGNKSIFEYSLAPSYQPQKPKPPMEEEGSYPKFGPLLEGRGFPPSLIRYTTALDEAYEDPEMRSILAALKMGERFTCYDVFFDGLSDETSHQRAAILLGRIHSQFPILLHRSVRKIKVAGHRKPVFEYALQRPPVMFYTRVPANAQENLELPEQPEVVEQPQAAAKESEETNVLSLLAQLKAQLTGEMEKGLAEIEEVVKRELGKKSEK